MMLTPEQLGGLRAGVEGGAIKDKSVERLLAHIDVQQARIADLDGLLTSASNHCNATANERNELRGRVTELERDRDHWKANHDNQVVRARLLTEREDLPLERVKAYQRMQELEANNTSLLSLLAQIREACGDNGKRMPDELVAYIGELAKDAARYRWLRKQHWNDCAVCVVTNPKQAVKLGSFCPSAELLDNFIDTSLHMEEQK